MSESRLPCALFIACAALACAASNPIPRETGSAEGGIETGGAQGLDGSATAGAGDSDSGGPRLDVGDGQDTSNGGDCVGPMGGGGDYDFSIIWIANTVEGTVSKVDTIAAVELARYRTGPQVPDPSRTSVNLLGDVVVGNRAGSVTKIAARVDDCVDTNADGKIRTSQGPNDVLAWGEDECVLWIHEVPYAIPPDTNGYAVGGPRGIAWDRGDASTPCAPNPRVWVGWGEYPNPVAKIRRLDGKTGVLEEEIDVPDWLGIWGNGIYGAATDADGAYWGLGTQGALLRVDPDTLAVQKWNVAVSAIFYGMALDASGTPWIAAHSHIDYGPAHVWRFDTSTHEFIDLGAIPGGPAVLRGMAIDAAGQAWIAGNQPCGLVRFDTNSASFVENVVLPGCAEPVGVSIDVEGHVWVVDKFAEIAFKVDPDDYSIQTVAGFTVPYTYSDMTGAGLDLVVHPPG